MGIGGWLLIPFLWPLRGGVQPYDSEKAVDRSNEGDDDENNVDADEDIDHTEEDHQSDDIDEGDVSHPRRTPRSTVKLPLLTRVKSVFFPSPQAHEEDEAFIPNHRILPILSGIMIPFAILLEIPGFTNPWFVRMEGSQIVAAKQNSAILVIGLAFSILCAVIANVCLFVRFLEKGNVRRTTVLAIIAISIHDAINIICVAVFAMDNKPHSGFTYGSSYWIVVCSTFFSSLINITLLWDLFMTPNFSQSGSGLTRKQRSLVIIIMILLCYIALGALAYSFLLDLKYVDALYFTVVSIETVGFGDIVPDNAASRTFTCFYIAFGVFNLGVMVVICRETVFEWLEIGYRKRMASLRQRHAEHQKWVTSERAWKDAVEWRLGEMGIPAWIRDGEPDVPLRRNAENSLKRTVQAVFRRLFFMFHRGHTSNFPFRYRGQVRGITYGYPGTHLNIEALSYAQLLAATVEAGVPLDMFRDPSEQLLGHRHSTQSSSGSFVGFRSIISRKHYPCSTKMDEPISPVQQEMRRMAGMLTKFALASTRVGINVDKTPHGDGDRRSEDFYIPVSQRSVLTPTESFHAREQLMVSTKPPSTSSFNFAQRVKILERRARWFKLLTAWVLFLAFWLVGAGIFSATEGWSYGNALYFCFITFTTTGYGDFVPTTIAGRSIFILWALFGLGTVAVILTVLQEAFSSGYKRALHSGPFQKALKEYRKRRKYHKPFFPPSHPVQLSVTNAGPSGIQESNERAQKQLEELPGQILRLSRTIYQHIEYFTHRQTEIEAEYGLSDQNSMPADLKDLLDDFARARNFGNKVKIEILQDEDARNALLIVSVEKVLQEMTDLAERSFAALAERDRLATVEHGCQDQTQ